MQTTVKDCQCTIAGMSADCKQCFPEIRVVGQSDVLRGGQRETRTCYMEREERVKPRMLHCAGRSEEFLPCSGSEDDNFGEVTTHLSSMMREPLHKRGGRMVDDSLLLERNRTSLRKFESLEINGTSLTGMSIGGFDIDIAKAAQKAQEIIPVPAAKLPLIFMDETLNFYFHFFDGMGRIFNENLMNSVIRCDHHFATGSTEIIDQIEDMIRSSFDRHDSEQMIFMKKIMIGTFETYDDRRNRSEDPVLIVAANLYGLQYIEPGMKMRDHDLRDWLNRCHGHYKTLWFNTFKATSVPEFAYSKHKTCRSDSYSSSNSSRMPDLLEEGREDASTIRSHRRHRKSSAGASSYPRSASISSSKAKKITKWMAAS